MHCANKLKLAQKVNRYFY